MTRLHTAHRLRALTETSPRCPRFTPPPNDAHGFCLRCGAEEWPHVARAAAELLDAAPVAPAIGDTSDPRRRDGSAIAGDQAIDITNWQGVALSDAGVLVYFPQQAMTAEAALVHAAWLIVVAERLSAVPFSRIWSRVLGT